jgi:pyruvate formate lyase activating enzyme
VDDAGSSETIRPSEAIELARRYHCRGLAWTYNEPSIWFEYTLDSAKLAKQNGLYTVYVTNGFLTPEALDAIGPYLDAWRVDVKGFSDSAYRSLTRLPKWKEILDVAERAQNKWNMHVEVVTNIIPGLNDDEGEIYGIAQWISKSLGELTPWHVTRFYPQHKLNHLPSTPISTLERACQIGREAGLKFVYIGNVPGHALENTTCYSCGRVVVKRTGYKIEITGVDREGRCQFCGADLNIRS